MNAPTDQHRRRIIVAIAAAPAPKCEDCGTVLTAAEIRDYRRESNMGPGYRGIPRCCDACASAR